jgi:hypothetical protein
MSAHLFVYLSLSTLITDFYLFFLFLGDEEDPKRFAIEAPATDTLVVNEPPSQEVDAAAKPQKAVKKPAKKAVTVHSSRRL